MIPSTPSSPNVKTTNREFNSPILFYLRWGFLVGLEVTALVFILKARREETWLTQKYLQYTDYQQRVKKLIPGLYWNNLCHGKIRRPIPANGIRSPRVKHLTDGGSSLSTLLAFIINTSASHKIDLYDATKLDVQYTIT